ncbi:16S rRNA (cytosine(1402)-N(4))-methyltransferase RsmH [Ferrimicrobium sp.]|uniref:16S rRNA (cytosine(1402)-N(4))-methyltransferase RsmH n=1 Tax=Ferrimicrobium sp. TaxID=2926050 RepID=UPI0026313775|nr:16S rRNA (cytosine(1402)-N(4))-methyltransferase RsmH [Ferrimicrobium sp.]
MPSDRKVEEPTAVTRQESINPPNDPIGGRPRVRYAHAPVLAAQVVDGFREHQSASVIIVDATIGLGGHAQRILDDLEWSHVVGVDRDRQALASSRERLAPYGDRVRLLHGRFGDVMAVTAPLARVAGVLADLGVSSLQLDDPGRGFSFRFDAPLDMRMDQDGGSETVAEYLLSATPQDLVAVFRENGVGSLASRYASAIKSQPPATTGQLAEVIAAATPARLRGGRLHPATKVFQALRIRVNQEQEELLNFLPLAFGLLDRGGVMQVISYHSGEDRIVKRFMHLVETGGCVCPPRLGCNCGAQAVGSRMMRHALIPSEEEQKVNPRSRSARLRMLRRTADDISEVVQRYWEQVPSWHV